MRLSEAKVGQRVKLIGPDGQPGTAECTVVAPGDTDDARYVYLSWGTSVRGGWGPERECVLLAETQWEYAVVTMCGDEEEFGKGVTEWLNAGWTPVGGVSMSVRKSDTYYSQALTRRAPAPGGTP